MKRELVEDQSSQKLRDPLEKLGWSWRVQLSLKFRETIGAARRRRLELKVREKTASWQRSGENDYSNGNCAKSPILHRFEIGEVVERCKECNRKQRKFTNEKQRGTGLWELEIGLGGLGQNISGGFFFPDSVANDGHWPCKYSRWLAAKEYLN